ncbi:hypothetical protein KAW18_00970 [candidate division WOR-3 bacterium]|nr:hypothetical protein [candidate division WOR-3 bacterium]
MQGLTKETFLKAEDPRNRDAMLYDMLSHINGKIDGVIKLKKDVDSFKAQVSFIKKLFVGAMAIFTAVSIWLTKS